MIFGPEDMTPPPEHDLSATVQQARKIDYWYGKPVGALTREELFNVIEFLGRQVEALTKDRERWSNAGDPLKYLMSKENTGSI